MTSLLHLLWDESHIWGLLAARAVRAFGLPHRIVTAEDIRNGILQKENPSMLLVPGGSARFKAKALGEKGAAAVRDFVGKGGSYLGFCGGAGLALSWEGKAGGGLGLCPWKRGGFSERMQHFMSGHLHVNVPQHAVDSGLFPSDLHTGNTVEGPLLPVWWPGRFSHEHDPSITILATYRMPGPDFWLTDLPIASLPAHMFKVWDDMYGFSISPTFLEGQPCAIYGEYGKGRYVLSYSHLETPASPDANRWLAHLFRVLGNLSPKSVHVPAWDADKEFALWDNDALAEVEANIQQVAAVGLEHGMLFARNDWLLGWRTGIPGANLNNLLSLAREARRSLPGSDSLVFWREVKEDVVNASRLFLRAGEEYLLTERLAMTLAKTLPETLPPALLRERRAALFGPPMQAGGLYRDLLEPLDRLACMQLS